jgi:transcriptional regulator GlxA family with amidase domain
MQIAILIFEKLTALDAIGPYEVLRSVPDWEVKFVGPSKGPIRTDSGALGLNADYALAEVTDPDIVLVPGGEGNRPLMEDQAVLGWLRDVDETSKWTTSVCTGSLVLGAAGLLKGKRATTHWLYLERLREFGADPVGERFVEDGKVITAAGVSAGIDMALHLVAREVGPEVAQAVQLGIEYDPQPPFDTGSPAKAPAQIVETVTAVAPAQPTSGSALRSERRRAAPDPAPATAPRQPSAGCGPRASRPGGRRSAGWRGGQTGR